MNKIFLYKKEGSGIVKTEIFSIVDDEDYERISKNTWYLVKIYHCDTDILYARRYEGSPKKGNHRAILMHREILGAEGRDQKVDHIDGNGLNNSKSNIRICSHSDNMSNRKVAYNKEIKYLGVIKKGDKYIASLKNNGINYRSKLFDTAELAAIAYNDMVHEHKPIYGKQNVLK